MIAHLAASLHTLGFTVQARLRREETGATAVEYAMLTGVIAVALIAALTVFGPELKGMFNNLIPDTWKTAAG